MRVVCVKYIESRVLYSNICITLNNKLCHGPYNSSQLQTLFSSSFGNIMPSIYLRMYGGDFSYLFSLLTISQVILWLIPVSFFSFLSQIVFWIGFSPVQLQYLYLHFTDIAWRPIGNSFTTNGPPYRHQTVGESEKGPIL